MTGFASGRTRPLPGSATAYPTGGALLREPLMVFLALSLTFFLAACGGGGALSGWSPDTAPRGDVELRVENYHWADVRIYALVDGTRHRMGRVGSQTTKTFTVPRAIGPDRERIVFEAHPLASPSVHRSEPVHFSSGERLIWRLENHLPQSAFFVR